MSPSLPSRGPAPEKANHSSSLSASTLAIHADDHLAATSDVAPPLHVSTTFRYPSSPSLLIAAADLPASFTPPCDTHVYSRHTAPNTTRLEALLSSLLNAHAVTYSSGLAALHAALVFLNPRRLSIGDGYHGSHGVVAIHQKLTGMVKLPLDCPADELQPGDVIHLETPVNPTGEAFNIASYAAKAHARGALLLVDATFGPPGLQDPFAWGADVVMHSGTKYLAGHSDMLCGVLAVKKKEWMEELSEERASLGSVMGSLEGWLGVRSLRTLELRVKRQSETAGRLVGWLHGLLGSGAKDGAAEEGQDRDAGLVRRVVDKVTHASLQDGDRPWLEKQMPGGYGPVFAIWMRDEGLAKRLPSLLGLFHHATSLGGVESLIEWRAMSDTTCSRSLLRVSVGVEAWEDLKADLLGGFAGLLKGGDDEKR